MNNTGKFLRGVLREPHGRGGAIPERDENGAQAATTEEHMAIIERGYGRGWCPGTPDVREGADWLTEVFMPRAWIDPAVYDGLLVPVTDKEMKSTLDKEGGTAPGPNGVTRKLLRNGGEASVDMLRDAYNLILASGEWPRDMLLGLIFPICKKEGHAC